jgi:hypothetical protein
MRICWARPGIALLCTATCREGHGVRLKVEETPGAGSRVAVPKCFSGSIYLIYLSVWTKAQNSLFFFNFRIESS